MKIGLTIALCLAFSTINSQNIFTPWQQGYLDIHHISTGSGNAAVIIYPDGTTLLFDAGEIRRNISSFGLKSSPRLPHDSLSAAKCIANYVRKVKHGIKKLDYAVVSHFHPDHFGGIDDLSKKSSKGDHKLSGITEVHEYLPINTLIDRGYPLYNFPVDIASSTFDPKTFTNYQSFVKHLSRTGKVEQIKVGRKDQIVLKTKAFANCYTRNICGNGEVWTGVEDKSIHIVPQTVDTKDYNENPLSIGLKITYGKFDYFTAGDLTGLSGYGLPEWFDMETPASAAVGDVDAFSLNHHGVRDAINVKFLERLRPRVIIQQSWSSNHPGEEVLHRLISPAIYPGPRDIFATYIHSETALTYGKWMTENYKSMQGHIVIRVEPGGDKYFVYILDDTSLDLNLLKSAGPYVSKD